MAGGGSTDPFASYQRFDDLTTAAIGPHPSMFNSVGSGITPRPTEYKDDATEITPHHQQQPSAASAALPYGTVELEQLIAGTAHAVRPHSTCCERAFRFPLPNVERKNNQKCLGTTSSAM